MNGCVVNLNEKGIKTYLKVQFNSPVFNSSENNGNPWPDMVWIQQGDSCKYIILGSGVIMVQSIPTTKAE